MKKITIILTALILICPLPAVAGPKTQDRKTRRQLEKENVQLRERLESIQQELEWLKADKTERDSLERQLEALYREDRNKAAAGMDGSVDYFDSPVDFQDEVQADGDMGIPEVLDYTDDVTDSLLSVWYLHRQIRENPQANYNMDSVHFTSGVPDQVLIERLEKMNSFIRLPYNETVKNYMVLYSEKMPTRMSQMLGLAQYYMPIFEEAFRKYGLPLELKYMAIIESALNPVAVSRVGATGMWQFMHSTARNYGLRIDSYIDDRMDPVASVDAAARYLRDAYRIFGDWSLAISSYNCGSGNVNKAIKRAGRRDFWSIYPYLPRETRGYVPAMVGAMYLCEGIRSGARSRADAGTRGHLHGEQEPAFPPGERGHRHSDRRPARPQPAVLQGHRSRCPGRPGSPSPLQLQQRLHRQPGHHLQTQGGGDVLRLRGSGPSAAGRIHAQGFVGQRHLGLLQGPPRRQSR